MKANAESPVLKSQEIFGAVKIKDGLFLGDQYSPQVKITFKLLRPFFFVQIIQILTINLNALGVGSRIFGGKQDITHCELRR